MNVALLLLLYSTYNFVIQILPCVNYLCIIAHSSLVLKHITSHIHSAFICICTHTYKGLHYIYYVCIHMYYIFILKGEVTHVSGSRKRDLMEQTKKN